MDDSFDKLAEVVKFYNLDIVENSLDDFNSLELYFYKYKDSQNSINDSELAGRMNYDLISNELDIDWDGKTPRMVVIAVDSYIREMYQKDPKNYLINSFGLLEPFDITKD